MPTQGLLPGFEFMSDDDNKKRKDAELSKELAEARKEYAALKDCYSSPFKLIGCEQRIQSLLKQKEDLWKVPLIKQ